MIYTLTYDGLDLAEVEIQDTPAATQAIKEMVEFWSGWQIRLDEADGDYTKCWLKQLAVELLENGERHLGDEGWYELDGAQGITLKNYWHVDPVNTDLIGIQP